MRKECKKLKKIIKRLYTNYYDGVVEVEDFDIFRNIVECFNLGYESDEMKGWSYCGRVGNVFVRVFLTDDGNDIEWVRLGSKGRFVDVYPKSDGIGGEV